MWVKLDDEFFDNPKVARLGDKAQLLYIASLTYAAKHLTDGCLSERGVHMAKALVGARDKAVKELVDGGLWESGQDCYMIHDWAQYNPPAAKVRAEREAARQRMLAARSGKGSGKRSLERSGEVTGDVHPTPVSRTPLPGNPVPVPPAEAAGERARPFILYEQAFGKPVPNQITADRLIALEEDRGAECLAHCLEEGALAGAKDIRYIERIAERHGRDGCEDKPIANSAAPADLSFFEQRYAKAKEATA